jgi:hypothetical protein
LNLIFNIRDKKAGKTIAEAIPKKKRKGKSTTKRDY